MADPISIKDSDSRLMLSTVVCSLDVDYNNYYESYKENSRTVFFFRNGKSGTMIDQSELYV